MGSHLHERLMDCDKNSFEHLYLRETQSCSHR
jgi:hypothetical protein